MLAPPKTVKIEKVETLVEEHFSDSCDFANEIACGLVGNFCNVLVEFCESLYHETPSE